MPRRVALLDANVLYPARIRDLLIRLDISGLYQARWSEQILDECFRKIVENRPDLSPERLATTRLRMNAALPAAMVDDFEGLIADQDLPDPDDHHVLAAALKAGASFVTNNLDDFPAGKVPNNIVVLSPDDFVMQLMAEDPDSVVDTIEGQAAALVNPPTTTSDLLDGLAEVGLMQTVAQIRAAIT